VWRQKSMCQASLLFVFFLCSVCDSCAPLVRCCHLAHRNSSRLCYERLC
jgi:hypothetical protein